LKTIFQLVAWMMLLAPCSVGYSQSDADSAESQTPPTKTVEPAETTEATEPEASSELAEPAEEATPIEKSVKPGINDKYTDPELDVDKWVKRFEIESREVYVNRETILTECDIEPGDTVADIGAGTGLFSRMFSKAVGEEGWVYSVDISPRFLEHINREAAKNNLNNITSVLCAENSVNLPPNSVDVFFICDTYHHFEYPKSTLASIKKALKPDGHLILIDFERIQGKTRRWIMRHVRAGKQVFRGEIQQAGFKLVDDKWIEGFRDNYFLKFKLN